MSVGLLDVNMLIALAWPSHVHHARAQAWFTRHARKGWATCPLTQCAFVRISSNPRIIPEAVSPRETLRLLGQVIARDDHVFWPDDIGLMGAEVPTALLVGHLQVTDAYLLGLAIRNGGRLVTLDKGIAGLLGAGSPHRSVLEIVPAE